MFFISLECFLNFPKFDFRCFVDQPPWLYLTECWRVWALHEMAQSTHVSSKTAGRAEHRGWTTSFLTAHRHTKQRFMPINAFHYLGRLRRLRLFVHVARSDQMQDHTRALSACISNPPRDWRRPRGRPRQTWIGTIEKDLQEQNLGLWTAWFYARDRVRWRKVVETATLQ